MYAPRTTLMPIPQHFHKNNDSLSLRKKRSRKHYRLNKKRLVGNGLTFWQPTGIYFFNPFYQHCEPVVMRDVSACATARLLFSSFDVSSSVNKIHKSWMWGFDSTSSFTKIQRLLSRSESQG